MSSLKKVGIFVGPEGALDVPKDVNPGSSLRSKRLEAAESAFNGADLHMIEDYDNNWTEDGVFYSRKVYWQSEGDAPCTLGSFGVQFKPDSDEVVDSWTN